MRGRSDHDDHRQPARQAERPGRRRVAEIGAAFEKAGNDPECGVVILTGAGPKAFVAGADIGELAQMDVVGGKKKSERGQAVLSRIENLGKPVIAMINGYAFGGGLELALACHVRTMAAETKIGLPEVGLGIIPGYGGTQRLPRIIGRGRALELILTGDPIDAATAHACGLVNRVAPADELLEVTVKLAEATARATARWPWAWRLESVLRGSGPSDGGAA